MRAAPSICRDQRHETGLQSKGFCRSFFRIIQWGFEPPKFHLILHNRIKPKIQTETQPRNPCSVRFWMETKGNHLIPTWFPPEALYWSRFGWNSAFASLCWTVLVNYWIRNKFRKYLCIFPYWFLNIYIYIFYQTHQFHETLGNTSVQTLCKLKVRETCHCLSSTQIQISQHWKNEGVRSLQISPVGGEKKATPKHILCLDKQKQNVRWRSKLAFLSLFWRKKKHCSYCYRRPGGCPVVSYGHCKKSHYMG